MERWIGPYRSIGEHWLPSAEVHELRRIARKYIAYGRLVLVAGFVLMFGWALCSLYALVFYQHLWFEQRFLVFVWMVGGILSIIGTAWGGYRLVRRGQEKRCEALVGVYERFVLTVDAESIRQTFGIELDEVTETPRPGPTGSDWYIDVYPISQRIRTVNGTIPTSYQKATIRTIAPARMVGMKDFPAALSAESGSSFLPRCGRHLNVLERSELRSIVFRYFKRNVAPWLGGGLACGLLTWLGIAWMPDVVDTLAFGALIFTWTCFTAVVYRSYQFMRDLRSSFVIEMSSKDKAGEGQYDDPLEVLPHTRLVWTRDGQPASWRKT